MEKHIVDGKVAVIFSPGYGAGWATWTPEHYEALAMDARIVKAFINGGPNEMISVTENLYPEAYTGGAHKARIEWVEKGKQFRIEGYNGFESIVVIDSDSSILTA